jgi:hypothetical protein
LEKTVKYYDIKDPIILESGQERNPNGCRNSEEELEQILLDEHEKKNSPYGKWNGDYILDVSAATCRMGSRS